MSLVELHDVVKRYGANTVLDRVSLTVERAEIIAVIGRSGSGKSTMLRCINGLEPIQEGRIVFDGEYHGRARSAHSSTRAPVSVDSRAATRRDRCDSATGRVGG